MQKADIPESPEGVERWLNTREEHVEHLRPEARSRIVWGPEGRVRTRFCLVYLHGFKATHEEGDPVHFRVARALGCNLLLTRLRGHGLLRERPLLELREGDFTGSALQAIEAGLRLGEEVILMGTSTGGSMALWLAGLERYRDRIRALVLYSPLIDFHGLPSRVLKSGLARGLLSRVPGRKFLISSPPASGRESRIWYSAYALQGALALGAFIGRYMTPETFRRVQQPLMAGYWPDDRVASPRAVVRMTRQVGTDSRHVRLRSYPAAGSHVICSGLLSDAVDVLTEDTVAFLRPLLPGTRE